MKKIEIKCPVEHSVELLGGKWKLPILHALVNASPKRFKELEREIKGITPTMLTNQLRSLETDGLVSRKIFATVPPTVEYSLTELGKSIKPMMVELQKWGLFHQHYLQSQMKSTKKEKTV
ncbi:winged helix-turn-helix transcriptional regulator [Sporocytophaga myxococcoides]|uniref:winged helix-turn-helix transcriptional regulator n=1 Tax=Sporocytophaga myxococcoides TaxID=153721 RepID=UPI0003FD18FC|nr:helix-turn-helix domain-containing protein [Sporocytophaga myxococcoides]